MKFQFENSIAKHFKSAFNKSINVGESEISVNEIIKKAEYSFEEDTHFRNPPYVFAELCKNKCTQNCEIDIYDWDYAEAIFLYVSQPEIYDDFCEKSLEYDLSITEYVEQYEYQRFCDWYVSNYNNITN